MNRFSVGASRSNWWVAACNIHSFTCGDRTSSRSKSPPENRVTNLYIV